MSRTSTATRLPVPLDLSGPPCPAVSPESAVPCDLPDRYAAHGAGHLGTHPTLGRPHRVGWYTTDADRARWGEAARADDET